MKKTYDDIINLPHHVSGRHPRMPVSDRAAQFSPFAALSGYEGEIKEAARLTDQKIELSEDQRIVLDGHIQMLESMLPRRPEVSFTYFKPDMQKNGGAYVTVTGRIKKIDRLNQTIVLMDGVIVPVEDLLQMDSEIWE